MLKKFKKAFWLFGISVLMFFIFLPGYAKLQDLRERNRDLEAKIKRLNIENALLSQESHLIENDPVYQERIARERMGIVRKGEIPVKIIPRDKE